MILLNEIKTHGCAQFDMVKSDETHQRRNITAHAERNISYSNGVVFETLQTNRRIFLHHLASDRRRR